jgi:hypothetical protein
VDRLIGEIDETPNLSGANLKTFHSLDKKAMRRTFIDPEFPEHYRVDGNKVQPLMPKSGRETDHRSIRELFNILAGTDPLPARLLFLAANNDELTATTSLEHKNRVSRYSNQAL